MAEIDVDLRAPIANDNGATWDDVFAAQGGMNETEQGRKILAAQEEMTSNRQKYSVLGGSVSDSVGMAVEAADVKVLGMSENLERQFDNEDERSLAPFRQVYAEKRDANMRSAAESILLSDADPKVKRQRLIDLAAKYKQPVSNDVEGYAHYAAATNPNIPDSQKAEAAEQVARAQANEPEVMVKQAIREFESLDYGPSVLKNFVSVYGSNYRVRDVLEKVGITDSREEYQDKTAYATKNPRVREFEKLYMESTGPQRRELTLKVLSAVKEVYGTDKMGAIDALNSIFEVPFAYKDGMVAVESAQRGRAGRGMWDVADIALGIGDAGSLAGAVKAGAKIAKEYDEVVKIVMKEQNVTREEAVKVVRAKYKDYKAAKTLETAEQRIVKSPSALRPGTAAAIDAALNPDKVAARMQEALSEGVDVSKMTKYGLDDASAMDLGILPRQADEVVHSIPDIGKNMGISKAYDELLTNTIKGISRAFSGATHAFLRAPEIANMANRADAEVAQVFKDQTFGDVALNKSSQMATQDGFLTQYVVTGQGKAFTAQEAVDAAYVYNTHADDTVRLMYKPLGETKFMPVEAPVKMTEEGGWALTKKMPEGEYAVALVRKTVYTADDAVGEGMTLPGHLGRHAAQLDKSTQFVKDIVDPSSFAVKQRGLIESSLHDAMEPFSNLGGKLNPWKKMKSQARVMEAVRAGSEQGKLFNSTELVESFGLNADELSAYYGIRARFDAEYFLNNMARRSELTEAGFGREIEIDGIKHFLKAVDKSEVTGVKHIAKPDGSVVAITDDYFEGTDFTVYKMNNRVFKDGMSTQYLVQRAGDEVAEGAYFGKMRDQVLPYHNGYVPRMYDANYIIARGGEAADEFGKVIKFEKAVASSQTKRAAIKYCLDNGLDPNTAIRMAREAMPTGRTAFSGVGKKRSFGGIIFGKRGDALEDVEIGHIEDTPLLDGERNLKTLGDILNSSAGITSYRQTVEKVIARHIDRWNAEYGDTWRLDTIHLEKQPVNPTQLERFREAQAVREHIAMLQGIDETAMNSWGNRARMVIANSASNGFIRRWSTDKFADRVETNILKQVNRGLDSIFKSWNFTANIGLAPTAQIVLQSIQATTYFGLKGGVKYGLNPLKGGPLNPIKDFVMLTWGLSHRGKGAESEALMEWFARRMGMSRKEFDGFLDSYEASGIAQNIDKHNFLESIAMSDMVPGAGSSTMAGKAAGSAAWYIRKFADTSRKIGFDKGEFVNQTMAWLFQRQRMLADNPALVKTINSDPNVWKEITNGASNIVGNMDQSARLKHQDGLLGLVFQFTSYATKMSQMLIPRSISALGSGKVQQAYFNYLGRFGSDIYTNREKMRIAAVQLGLFGTAGVTIGPVSFNTELPGTDFKVSQMANWLVNTWMEDYGLQESEVPPQARDALYQGFIGAMMNHMLSETYDERVQADWATRFSPIGNLQTPAGRLFEMAGAIMQGNYVAIENNLSGPNFAQARKLWGLATHGGNVFTRAAVATVTGYEKPESVNDAAVFWDKIASLSPMYNNWNEAQAAEATGFFRSSDGTAILEANQGQIVLRRWLGLRDQAELPLLGAKAKMEGFYGEQGYGDAEGVQKVVASTKKQLKEYTKALNERKMSSAEFLDATAWLTTMRVNGLNEIERHQVDNALGKWYLEDALETKEQSFQNAIAKSMEGYKMHFSDAEFLLKRMPPFENQQKLIDLVNDYQKRAEIAYQDVD